MLERSLLVVFCACQPLRPTSLLEEELFRCRAGFGLWGLMYALTQPIPLEAELANLGELAPNVRIPLRGGQDKRFQRDKYQLAKLLTSCATEN